MLFRYSHINKLTSSFLSLIFCEANNYRYCCNKSNNFFIFFHLIKKILTGISFIGFSIISTLWSACFRVKRTVPVPLFSISFCVLISFTLLSINMNNYRVVNIFNLIKCLNKAGNIIAIINIDIVKAHSLKQVTFAFSATFS